MNFSNIILSLDIENSFTDITLNSVRTQDKFDLVKTYSDYTTDDENNNSPFGTYSNNCNYFSPMEFTTLTEDSDGFSIFSINCQSLNAHWDDLNDLLCTLVSDKFQFDIIGLSETFKISPNIDYGVDGYHKPIFKTRGDGDDCHGGVGLYIKDTVQFNVRNDISVFIPHVIETLFVEVQTNGKTIVVGIIYRPNTAPRADIDIFTSTIYDINNIIMKEKKTSFLIGDFNIDLLKFTSHEKTNMFLNNMFTQGYLPLITKPTRITRQTATLIDHIYSNKLSLNYTTGILITDLADHFGTFILSKSTTSLTAQHNFTSVRKQKPDNITAFRNELAKIDFSSVLQSNCPNESYNKFIDLYMQSYDNTCPLKKIKLTRKMLQREPWITNGILTSSKKKQKLFHNKMKHPNEQNIQKYKTYCRVFNKIRRAAKSHYYTTILQDNKHNIKKTWSILNRVIRKQNDKSSLPESFKINDKTESNSHKIANEFNSFFSSIGKLYGDKIPDVATDFKSYLHGHYPNNFFMIPTDPNDVIQTAKKIKSKSSVGHDNISSIIMKETIHEVAIPLTHIFNQSFLTAVIPEQMKIGKLTPIYKSGSHNSFNNYRPISVLPAFSKLLEKLVCTRLLKFLDQFDILYKYQFGFRSKHSTVHPILHLLNDIADSNDKLTKDNTIAIFLDLSKAFDTINHSKLLHKLNFYGIRGITNLWFQNYLFERKQYLNFNGVLSDTLRITCGVPQGSILGPILFLLYINDIQNSTALKLLSFADDTTIYASSPNINDLVEHTNSEMLKVYKWLCSNKLSLNISKTNYSLFGPTVNKCQIAVNAITLNNTVIARSGKLNKSKPLKFLGLCLDENLTWRNHISYLTTKLAGAIFIINKVKHVLPYDALKTLYYSLFHSHLIYGILAWGHSEMANKIFILQKKILRIINNKPFGSHTNILFKQCQILKFSDLHHLQTCLFVHDYKNNKLPASFDNFFTDNTHMNSRNSTNLFRYRPRTKFSSQLPKHKFPEQWNSLNNHQKLITSRGNFKKSLKITLQNQYESQTGSCANPLCPDHHPHQR